MLLIKHFQVCIKATCFLSESRGDRGAPERENPSRVSVPLADEAAGPPTFGGPWGLGGAVDRTPRRREGLCSFFRLF